MDLDRVSVRFENGIADVQLNRPDKMNALDRAMFEALAATTDDLAARPDLRCVVLSGAGRSFCVGIDLGSLAQPGGIGDLMERTHGEANLFQQAAWGWRSLPVPVIAAVHGHAFGGGCQIMLGADMRILAPQTEVSLMEIRWGLVPDMGAFALLRGLMRTDQVSEAVFTGKRYNAAEAVEVGLATRLADDPHAAAMDMARAIAASSPPAIRAAKRLLSLPATTADSAILLSESREQGALLASAEHREAVRGARP